MMRYVLLALALLLMAAGLGSLYQAIDLAGIERGTMFAICGTIAASAGVMTLGLASILSTLDRRAASPSFREAAPPPVVEALGAPAKDFSADPTPAAPAHASPEAAKPVERAAVVGAALIAARQGKDAVSDTMIGDAADADNAALTPGDALDWLDKGLKPSDMEGSEPRIVGRYQASGVDYVMFSDGSIEADNGGARQRFASLADLKAFIAAS